MSMKQVVVAVGIVVCVAIGAYYLGSKSSAPLQEVSESLQGHPGQATFEQVAGTVRDKCMACHTRDYDLPFYSSIPGIKQIIEKDYTDGLRVLDLREDFGENPLGNPVNQATLAKMEWVMLNNTMPPAKFTAVHWSSRLTQEERDAILEWVKISRATHYGPSLAAPKHANEPVQPLPQMIFTEPAKVALGFKLFNDTRLSGDDTVSCATCHDVNNKAGTDNGRFATGVREQLGDVNAPTVFNAVFNIRQFWDGRAADLVEQADGPPFNPIEMASNDWSEILAKLSADEALTAEFLKVYPDGWSGESVRDAIAEYEKTLITPNSAFDKWLMGDDKALTQDEITGYERFKSYRCASCHVGQILGGQSFEYMNLKDDYFTHRGEPLGSDKGLHAFSGKPDDMHRFKVPTLRNIELTGPYLHDGTIKTLDEAVRTMGVYLSGLDIPPSDRKLIVAFLRTLTGEYNGVKLTGTVTPE